MAISFIVTFTFYINNYTVPMQQCYCVSDKPQNLNLTTYNIHLCIKTKDNINSDTFHFDCFSGFNIVSEHLMPTDFDVLFAPLLALCLPATLHLCNVLALLNQLTSLLLLNVSASYICEIFSYLNSYICWKVICLASMRHYLFDSKERIQENRLIIKFQGKFYFHSY